MNEEELKKGCGKIFDRFKYEDIKIDCRCDRLRLCEVCDARLEGFQKGKLEERERFGRIIHDLEDDIFNMSSLGMLSYMNVITRIKQLQKEIGEEKGK